MIPIETIRIVEYVIIGVSGFSFLACLLCALYAVPWNRKTRKEVVTKDFHLFWKTRVILLTASAVWMLAQWLRLEAFWQPGSQIFPDRVTQWTGNGTLCRVYFAVSMGLLEPFCLFTAVLLCKSVLSKRRPQDVGWPNAWVVAVALMLTVPFVAVQTVTAWMSVIIPGHDWETNFDTGRYFLAPYVVGSGRQCDNSEGKPCLLCFFPTASNIESVIAASLAAALLWHATQRMIGTAINRRLRFRLRSFQLSMIAVMTTMCATRAATIVRGTPFSWVFQMLWLAHFLTLPALVFIYTLFLVILPTWETGRAAKGVRRMQKELRAERRLEEREGSWKDSSERGPPSQRRPSPASIAERTPEEVLLVEQDKEEVESERLPV